MQHCRKYGRKLEKRENKGRVFSAFMTHLSKTIGCLHHESLIVKLDAYSFDVKPVKLI